MIGVSILRFRFSTSWEVVECDGMWTEIWCPKVFEARNAWPFWDEIDFWTVIFETYFSNLLLPPIWTLICRPNHKSPYTVPPAIDVVAAFLILGNYSFASAAILLHGQSHLKFTIQCRHHMSCMSFLEEPWGIMFASGSNWCGLCSVTKPFFQPRIRGGLSAAFGPPEAEHLWKASETLKVISHGKNSLKL